MCLARICCTLISMLGRHFSQAPAPANWDMSITCTCHKHTLMSDPEYVPQAAANTRTDAHLRRYNTPEQMPICVGTIPSAWGEAGSFPALSSLKLGGSFLNGSLLTTWGSNGTLSDLVLLELANSNFSGTLPPEWGASNVFQDLSMLTLTNCSISGVSWQIGKSCSATCQ